MKNRKYIFLFSIPIVLLLVLLYFTFNKEQFIKNTNIDQVCDSTNFDLTTYSVWSILPVSSDDNSPTYICSMYQSLKEKTKFCGPVWIRRKDNINTFYGNIKATFNKSEFISDKENITIKIDGKSGDVINLIAKYDHSDNQSIIYDTDLKIDSRKYNLEIGCNGNNIHGGCCVTDTDPTCNKPSDSIIHITGYINNIMVNIKLLKVYENFYNGLIYDFSSKKLIGVINIKGLLTSDYTTMELLHTVINMENYTFSDNIKYISSTDKQGTTLITLSNGNDITKNPQIYIRCFEKIDNDGNKTGSCCISKDCS
jgi:hypothetical protein